MQQRKFDKLFSDLFNKAAPVATIMLLYVSVYYANIDKLAF